MAEKKSLKKRFRPLSDPELEVYRKKRFSGKNSVCMLKRIYAHEWYEGILFLYNAGLIDSHLAMLWLCKGGMRIVNALLQRVQNNTGRPFEWPSDARKYMERCLYNATLGRKTKLMQLVWDKMSRENKFAIFGNSRKLLL